MSMRDDEGPTSGPDGAQGHNPLRALDRRRRGVRVTYAAAVALGLAIGGGAVAGAATGSSTSTTAPTNHADGPGGGHGFGGGPGMGGTPPAAFGTVASLGTDTFTLTDRDGTKVTVDVTGSTTYVDPSVTTATIADVKVGDHVAVFGTDTSNTVAATKVAIGGTGGPGGPGGMAGPGGAHGPDGSGGWAPPSSSGTSSSGSVSSGSATTSSVSSSGSTLN